jgi:hypothetical protein
MRVRPKVSVFMISGFRTRFRECYQKNKYKEILMPVMSRCLSREVCPINLRFEELWKHGKNVHLA